MVFTQNKTPSHLTKEKNDMFIREITDKQVFFSKTFLGQSLSAPLQ
jgi:hypothetical protein